METPTVGLDFSYYVTDGYNERLLGFNVTGVTDTNIANGAQVISGLLADLQGNNYYILTVDEGEDVVGGTLAPNSTIVGVGNGFISEYSFEASVGAIPTASVTVEAFNIKSDASENVLTVPSTVVGGTVGGTLVTITGNSPAVDLFAQPATKLTDVSKAYKLDYSRSLTGYVNDPGVNFTGYTTGSSTVSALRPGDIVLSLGTLQDKNLFDALVSQKNDLSITLKDSDGNGKIRYEIKEAILQSETYSENLGDNQTVDLTYTVQIGGANDTTAGLFMSGSYQNSLDSITSGFFKLGTGKLG